MVNEDLKVITSSIGKRKQAVAFVKLCEREQNTESNVLINGISPELYLQFNSNACDRCRVAGRGHGGLRFHAPPPKRGRGTQGPRSRAEGSAGRVRRGDAGGLRLHGNPCGTR